MMKTKHFVMIVLSGFMAVAMTSCNQGSSDKSADNEKQQLKEDLKDTGESAKALFEAEKEEAIQKAKARIEDFDKKIAAYEAKVKSQGAKAEAEMDEMIDDLKTRRKELASDVDEVKNATKEEWNDMKEEFKRDIDAFGESIREFFEDNV